MYVKIRKATINDCKYLNNFYTRLIIDQKKYDENINVHCIIDHYYEDLIDNESVFLIVAEIDNQVVGYLFAYEIFGGNVMLNRMMLLDAIFIDEEYRNQNLGTILINHLKQYAILNEIKYIELNVCKQNIKAINLYHKNGFTATKQIMDIKLY